jgi:hypothetical protein
MGNGKKNSNSNVNKYRRDEEIEKLNPNTTENKISDNILIFLH